MTHDATAADGGGTDSESPATDDEVTAESAAADSPDEIPELLTQGGKPTKVIGRLSDTDGIGVLGEATGTGNTAGVLGMTDSSDGYGLSTPDDAKIEGDIESPGGHTLTVGGAVTLALGPPTSDDTGDTAGGNVIGGYSGNGVQNSALGATIGGGGSSDSTDLGGSIGTRANTNEVTGDYGTIAGGKNNRAAGNAVVGGGIENTANAGSSTVAGGWNNRASDAAATVGGGIDNVASGFRATVPGGRRNTADGSYSLAAGHYAKTNGYEGTMVFADSGFGEFRATGEDQFLVQAFNGVGLGTTSPSTQLHVEDAAAGDAFNDPSKHVAIIENFADGSPNFDETKANTLAIRGGPGGDPGTGVNFISFYNGDGESYGAIQGNGSGGTELKSVGSDYAEYLPTADPDAEFAAGDVIGVREGELVADAATADRAMVVSDQHIVLGNDPGRDDEGYETVAFTGQVPVRVRGTVEAGDLIVPAGEADGTAIAVDAEAWSPADGPVVGQAWERSDEQAVDEVTVAVGIDDPTLLGEQVAAQRERIDDLEGEVEQLRAENDELREQLTAVQDRLAALEQEDPSTVPADD